jgi:hypothetical protein
LKTNVSLKDGFSVFRLMRVSNFGLRSGKIVTFIYGSLQIFLNHFKNLKKNFYNKNEKKNKLNYELSIKPNLA